MSSLIILPKDASLKGKDISGAYLMAKTQPDPEQFHMFKKKESVETMAKSLLKHKIQNLTGKTSSDIEEEMGFPSTRDGGGVPVEVLRRLAHFLILQAVDQLEVPAELPIQPVVNKMTENLAVRQGRRSFSQMSPSPLGNGTPKRATRRSVAPELLRDATVTENVACRLKPQANLSNQTILEENHAEEIQSGQDLGIGENPTPMMIALKRKSLAAGTKPVAAKMEVRTPTKVVPKTVSPQRSRRAETGVSRPTEKMTATVSINENIQESPKKTPKAPRMTSPCSFSPVSQLKNISVRSPRFGVSSSSRSEFPGSDGCKIFLVNGDAMKLDYNDILRVAPDFEGTNLTVLHTPVEWDPVRLLTFVLEIKRINQKAKLESYLVLIGCGIQNAKIVQEALFRQTRHVQFLVFERADQGLEGHVEGVKLREATSYFLLAYFFPGCQEEGSQPLEPMVRPGFSNCFRTKSIEDLENNILYALSEKGDWILDVFCRNREISLAAQKTGRNLIAIDPSHDMLMEVKAKAQAVACHHDKTFRPEVDGSILTL